MISKSELIAALVSMSTDLTAQNEKLNAAIHRTYVENNWLIQENYWNAISEWQNQLTTSLLYEFMSGYDVVAEPKKIGIIMAGNIPMVGFHDLLCVLLTGHIARIKTSSDDPYVIPVLCSILIEKLPALIERIQIVDRVNGIDAAIATGSNNSFRYFEQYFSKIPALLRKNRKSMAVLSGQETPEELASLSDDIFQYFGLGCRNVSLIFLPKNMPIVTVLDATMKYKELVNHNKFANNYTYHRALLLMNSEQHLDTGFALPKERKDLHAPLACLHYSFYDNIAEVEEFIENNKNDLQCIVGNYCSVASTTLGSSQKPDLQDFADGENTLNFLTSSL